MKVMKKRRSTMMKKMTRKENTMRRKTKMRKNKKICTTVSIDYLGRDKKLTLTISQLL